MHPDLIAQLRTAARDGNDFAASLVRQHDKGKVLSLAQLQAAERMFHRDAASQAVAKADLSRCHGMFAAALASKLKAPRFRFGIEGSEIIASMPRGRNDGSVLYLKLDGEYCGKVEGGRYFPKAVDPEDATAIAARLGEVAADPYAAAIAYARDTGRCACCGALLTDDKAKGSDGLTSVQRGVGPTCAARWGLL